MTAYPNRLLQRITAPAAEPLSLSETKLYLRVDASDEDSLISNFISAARQVAEDYINISFINQSWKIGLDDYANFEVILPRGPVNSITSVKSITKTGVETTISSTSYHLNAASDRLCFDALVTGHRVEIVYATGFGADASDVPEALRQALLAHVAALYEMRGEGSVALPEQTKSIYTAYKTIKV